MLNSVAKSKRADSLTYGLGRTGTGPGYILLAMKAQVLVQRPFWAGNSPLGAAVAPAWSLQ